MTIENLIGDLIEALKENTEALKASGAKPAAKRTTKKAAAKKAAPAKEEKPAEDAGGSDDSSDDLDLDDGPTREDVKAALKDYAALEGKAKAIQILKDNGANAISELAEDKFQAVIDATSA